MVKRTSTRAIVVALIIALTGVGLILVKDSWTREATAPNEVLLAVASTLLGTGIIGVAYELYLRQSVARDLIRLVKLKEELVEAGISDLYTTRPSLHSESSRGVRIIHVIVDTDRWLREEWIAVVAQSKVVATHVSIVLPAERQADVTSFLAIDTEEGAARVRRALNQIERDWSDAERSGQLKEQASIAVFRATAAPRYELRVCDNRTWLLVSTAVGPRLSHPHELGLLLAGGSSRLREKLVAEVEQSLEDLEAIWSR
jgi:hypothetical protein